MNKAIATFCFMASWLTAENSMADDHLTLDLVAAKALAELNQLAKPVRDRPYASMPRRKRTPKPTLPDGWQPGFVVSLFNHDENQPSYEMPASANFGSFLLQSARFTLAEHYPEWDRNGLPRTTASYALKGAINVTNEGRHAFLIDIQVPPLIEPGHWNDFASIRCRYGVFITDPDQKYVEIISGESTGQHRLEKTGRVGNYTARSEAQLMCGWRDTATGAVDLEPGLYKLTMSFLCGGKRWLNVTRTNPVLPSCNIQNKDGAMDSYPGDEVEVSVFLTEPGQRTPKLLSSDRVMSHQSWE